MRELQPGFGQVSGGQCSYYKPVPSSLDDAPVTRRRARDLGASSSEAAANDDKGHKNDIVNNNNNNNNGGSMFSPGTPEFMRQHQQQGYWGGASPAPAEHHQRQHQGQVNYPRVKRARRQLDLDQGGAGAAGRDGGRDMEHRLSPLASFEPSFGMGAYPGEQVCQPASPPPPPPPQQQQQGLKRGNYRCSKCGQLKKGHVCPFKKQAKASTNQQQQSPSPGRGGQRGSRGELYHSGGAAMADPYEGSLVMTPPRQGGPGAGGYRIPGTPPISTPPLHRPRAITFTITRGSRIAYKSPPQQQRFVRDHRGQGASTSGGLAASGQVSGSPTGAALRAPPNPQLPAIFSRPQREVMDSWLVNCFATLEPEDLLTCSRVCSHWRKLAKLAKAKKALCKLGCTL